jgi:hypothetical protein
MELLPSLIFVQAGEQAIDQGLRHPLIRHRLEQFFESIGTEMCRDISVVQQNIA